MRSIYLIIGLLACLGGLFADDYNQQPMIGVQMTPTSTSVQKKQGLDINEGVYVRKVFPETAASDMGIQKGDVILQINNAPISSMGDLREEVFGNQVGDPVNVIVRRNGEDVVLGAQYREWPEDIPYTAIDSEAESRYKEMQKRRRERRQEADRKLAERHQELESELADNQQQRNQLAQAEAAAFLPDDYSGPIDGDTLTTAGLPDHIEAGSIEYIPLGLAALPAWNFSFDSSLIDEHVYEEPEVADDTSTTEVSTATTIPAFHFTYHMSVE